MCLRAIWAILLLPTFSILAHADIPGPDGRTRRRPQYIPPAPAPKLVISRDLGATTAKLILPKDMLASSNTDTPRMASMLPTNVLGLALMGSFIAGGLWLARGPRAKYGSIIVVFAVAVIGTALHAQPARLEAPREILERGKIHISRDGSATSIQLILAKKAASN